MREVLRTSSLSHAESLGIALESAGIPAHVNHNFAGLPMAEVTVVVVDDGDYDRALAILRTLEHPAFVPIPWRPSQLLLAILTAIIAILLALCVRF